MKRDTWFNKLGFKTNPLSIKPREDNKLFGNDEIIKRIIEGVEKGRMILVEGDYGSGKSTLLKRIIDEFRDDFRIIYYSCNRKLGSIDYDDMLVKAGTLFHKIFRIKKKHNILLLDEAQDMNIKDKELLPQYFDDGFFHSVVLVTSGNKPDFNKGEIKERIGDNHYKLNELKAEQAVELIRKRIGYIELINDDIIKKVFQRSRNPRQLLEDVEDLLRDAVENNKEEIKEEDISSVLGSEKKLQTEIE